MDTGRSQNRVGTYTYCTALQMEDSRPRVRLQDWPTSSALEDYSWYRTQYGLLEHLDSLLASLDTHDSFFFGSCSSIFVSPSSLSLHLRMRVSLNVSTSWLSRPGITAPLHTHSLVPRSWKKETVERLRNLREGTFPRPSSTIDNIYPRRYILSMPPLSCLPRD